MEADSASTIRNYIAAGLGIAILPVDTMVDQRVRSLAINSLDPERSVGIATLPNRQLAPLTGVFHYIARGLDEKYPGWADLLAE